MESLYAWQHLRLAGFITGTYPGTMTAAGALELPGFNMPDSKINGGGFDLFFLGINPDPFFSGSHMFFNNNANYGHVMTFGMKAPNTANNYTKSLEYFFALNSCSGRGLKVR